MGLLRAASKAGVLVSIGEPGLMGRRYENAPIIEALCELRFEPSVPWDLTFPGLVYERIRSEFPKRRQAKAFEVDFATPAEGVQQRVITTDRVQLLREDEKALVQIGQDLLAVNHLKPYPTWEKFLPLIRQAFDAYGEVAKPKGLQRISLRYINRFEFPNPADLDELFEFRPYLGRKLPQDYGSFVLAVQIPYEEWGDVLKLRLATAAAQAENVVALALDLEYSVAQTGRVPLDTAFDWMQTAHDRIEDVFEASITQKLRSTFDERGR